ncbi:MAG TPA: aminotransferase class IV, partial [Bdellovibrionota bacterium]|nr:aminotransferase class IV [Bdellovibrionota bacterium]
MKTNSIFKIIFPIFIIFASWNFTTAFADPPDGEEQPFVYRYDTVNSQGSFLPAERAGIAPKDLGMLRRHKVVKTISVDTNNNNITDTDLTSFREAAMARHMEVPLGDNKIKDIIRDLLVMNNNLSNPELHLVITGGVSSNGKAIEHPNFYILIDGPQNPITHPTTPEGPPAWSSEPQRGAFMNRSGPFCYFQGEFIPVSEVRVSPFDEGILGTKAVFDFTQTYDNEAFHLQDHLDRLRESARLNGVGEIPLTDEEIASILRTLIVENGMESPYIRIVFSAGVGGKPTFYTLIEPQTPFTQDAYDNGIKVILDEHERFLPESKNTEYSNAISIWNDPKSKGATEIIYTSQGIISEASTSNIFIVKDGKLLTTNVKILAGVTRQIILKLARDKGLTVEERQVSTEELLNADEVFLTAANKDVLPVVLIGDKKVGSGKVGPVTKLVRETYLAYIKKGEWKEKTTRLSPTHSNPSPSIELANAERLRRRELPGRAGEAAQAGRIEKLNVLIVDDDQQILSMFSAYLEGEEIAKQIQLFTASNREEMLKILEDNPINIVFMDYDLKNPQYTGLTLIMEIKTEYPSIRVYANSSGNADPNSSSYEAFLAQTVGTIGKNHRYFITALQLDVKRVQPSPPATPEPQAEIPTPPLPAVEPEKQETSEKPIIDPKLLEERVKEIVGFLPMPPDEGLEIMVLTSLLSTTQDQELKLILEHRLVDLITNSIKDPEIRDRFRNTLLLLVFSPYGEIRLGTVENVRDFIGNLPQVARNLILMSLFDKDQRVVSEALKNVSKMREKKVIGDNIFIYALKDVAQRRIVVDSDKDMIAKAIFEIERLDPFLAITTLAEIGTSP